MSGQDIRHFPQEIPGGAWPLLQPTIGDKQYQPGVPKVGAQQQQRGHIKMLFFDLRDACFKGMFLGLFCFALFFGITRNLLFWLQGWHWAIAVLTIVLLRILLGSSITVNAIALSIVIIGIITMIIYALFIPLLLFIIGGICIRLIFELLHWEIA